MPSSNLAGDTAAEQKLWRTYLFWARDSVAGPNEFWRGLDIAKPGSRLSPSAAYSLQAIVFTALALEYRLKRTLESLGVSVRRRDTLGVLLQHFRRRAETAQRFDAKGPVRLPKEWTRIEKRLNALVQARNRIVHAHHHDVIALISNRRQAGRKAKAHYNALVAAIRVINEATGRDMGSSKDRRAYYKVLAVTRN